MKTSFTKTCPKCNTIVSITEVGENILPKHMTTTIVQSVVIL